MRNDGKLSHNPLWNGSQKVEIDSLLRRLKVEQFGVSFCQLSTIVLQAPSRSSLSYACPYYTPFHQLCGSSRIIAIH
eukprot:scaffold3450_cov114-Cylindrotheca_fusiformis.AAC.19